jgi:phosphoglycerol transferase MdoB-like AlkP superfamily enzyme
MSDNSSSSSSAGGAGALSLLGVAFVVLKLTHVINWSWWWVTAPFWGGIALILVVMLIALAVICLREMTRVRRR